MNTLAAAPYKGHRFPQEIICHAMWLYYRFSLSYRDVEELLAQRGIVVTYETVRQWCLKFGQQYANQLRRRRAKTGDKWHLDEVFLKINGKTSYLWRAVDQDGNVLDILVQSRRNKGAAKKFFRKLLKGCTYGELCRIRGRGSLAQFRGRFFGWQASEQTPHSLRQGSAQAMSAHSSRCAPALTAHAHTSPAAGDPRRATRARKRHRLRTAHA